jgi:hypothetical protein
MLESARDSIPYSVSKLKVEEIFDGQDSSKVFENIVLELFDSKYNQEDIISDEGKAITYLPDHPVFAKFRNFLTSGIKKYNDNRSGHDTIISIPLFLTEFNSNLLIKLDEQKANSQDLKNLFQKWKTHQDFQNLHNYLKNAKKLYLKPNKIDGKSLSQYYVENKAYVVDKDTWGYDEQ